MGKTPKPETSLCRISCALGTRSGVLCSQMSFVLAERRRPQTQDRQREDGEARKPGKIYHTNVAFVHFDDFFFKLRRMCLH